MHRGPPHARVSAERRTGRPRRQDRGAWDTAADRRGSSAGARAPGRRGGSGSLPDPRSDQRRPHLRPRHTRHRLVAGRRPLRPARPTSTTSPIIALPGHRGRRARRPRGGAGGRRPSRGQAGRLSRLPCDPRRPAAPAGLQPAIASAYGRAIELAGNQAETAYLNCDLNSRPRAKRRGGPVGPSRRLPCSVAVAVGFEPTEGVNPHTLSRRAPSAARTRYRRRAYQRDTRDSRRRDEGRAAAWRPPIGRSACTGDDAATGADR